MMLFLQLLNSTFDKGPLHCKKRNSWAKIGGSMRFFYCVLLFPFCTVGVVESILFFPSLLRFNVSFAIYIHEKKPLLWKVCSKFYSWINKWWKTWMEFQLLGMRCFVLGSLSMEANFLCTHFNLARPSDGFCVRSDQNCSFNFELILLAFWLLLIWSLSFETNFFRILIFAFPNFSKECFQMYNIKTSWQQWWKSQCCQL